MIIYVFNSLTNRFERYLLEPYDNMPYTDHNSLSVRAFCKNSRSYIAWTTIDTMHAWNSLYLLNYSSLSPTCGFRRICEGGHPPQSQHYSGTAFDISCNLYGTGSFHSETPPSSSVHLSFSEENKYGYPTLSLGCIGVYVFVLQDALYSLGISPGALDGFFGSCTLNALYEFQHNASLNITGQADSRTWQKLTFLAAGIGNINKIPYLY